MHHQAEYGVAAHWRYKEKAKARRKQFEQKVAWLRQLLAWRDEVADGGKTTAAQPRRHDLRADAAGQGGRPAGGRDADRLRLRACTPTSATAAAAPRSTAQMVPLDYAAAERRSASRSSPRRAAGRRATGSTPSAASSGAARARHKMRQWFNAKALAETVAAGRAGVEKELRRDRRHAGQPRGAGDRARASAGPTSCSRRWRATR